MLMTQRAWIEAMRACSTQRGAIDRRLATPMPPSVTWQDLVDLLIRCRKRCAPTSATS